MPHPHGRVISSEFRPHPLLASAHLQTIWPSLLRPLPPLTWRAERLELPDGDFVDLGWCGEHHTNGPIAVLVHGLTGDFQSKYKRGTALELVRRGWRCVMLQLRGGGAEPNRTARLYNHGDTADLRHLWHWLRQREPHTTLVSLGWSLGANVIIKALAEEGDAAPIQAAAVACPPFQLEPCADQLRTGFSRVYQKKLLDELKVLLARKHARLPVPPSVNLPAALQSQDFFEFDNAYTAPLNGYRDAQDYYTRCSSGAFVGGVRRPTLIVHSLDDPFMRPEIVPKESSLAADVTLELSARGGHVGFISAGPFGQPCYWLETRLPDFLQPCLLHERQPQTERAADGQQYQRT